MRKYLPILFVLSLTLNNFIFAQDSEEETEISSVEALLMLVKEGKTKEQSENADREAKFMANKNNNFSSLKLSFDLNSEITKKHITKKGIKIPICLPKKIKG